MIFWMDANRHNWSLVMVTYIYSDETLSDERYKYGGHEEEYYYEDVGEDYEDDGEDYEDDGQDNEAADTYNDENYDAENDTVLTHTYPLRVGASENTAYTCGVCILYAVSYSHTATVVKWFLEITKIVTIFLQHKL